MTSFKLRLGWVHVSAVILMLTAVAVVLACSPVERLHTDPSRWMYEAVRISVGDIPYRDFTWQYFPAGIYLLGFWVSIIGNTLADFKAFTLATSALIVALMWVILACGSQSILSAGIITVVAAALTSLTFHERLFSLNLYTPAMTVGLIGVLVATIGFQRFAQRRDAVNLFVAAIGGTLAALSKVDFALYVITISLTVVMFGHFDKPKWPMLAWVTYYVIPLVLLTTSIILLVALQAGFRLMMYGLSGYGVAKSELYSLTHLSPDRYIDFILALIYLILGVALAFKLFSPEVYSQVMLRQRTVAWLGDWAGSLIVLLVLLLTIVFIGVNSSYLAFILRSLVGNAAWIAAGFLPAAFVLRYFGRGINPITAEAWTAILLATAVLTTSSRSMLWGSRHHSTQIFSGTCLIGYFIAVVAATRSRLIGSTINVGICLSGLLLSAATLRALHHRPWVTLHTERGDVRILPWIGLPLQQTLAWLKLNTSPSTYIVSAPYGTALNYLALRQSPLRQTQFSRMDDLPVDMREGDLQVFHNTSNLVIISQLEPESFVGPELSEAWSRAENPDLWAQIDRDFVLVARFEDVAVTYVVRERISFPPQ
jgi:hypothetical protein